MASLSVWWANKICSDHDRLWHVIESLWEVDHIVCKQNVDWIIVSLMQLKDGTCESEKELSKKYSYFDYPIEGMCR